MLITLKRLNNDHNKPLLKHNLLLGFYVPYMSEDNKYHIKVWLNGLTSNINGMKVITPNIPLINPYIYKEIIVNHQKDVNVIIFDPKTCAHNECSICLNSFHDKEKIVQTKCCHLFHNRCLEQWLKIKPNCPFCRADCF